MVTEGRRPLRHVAVIMDGNGRWARARGLPRHVGHRRGAEAVRALVENAAERGIRYLTLFTFSSENWSRPASEIDQLMSLLRLYLRREVAELHKSGVRLSIIGDRQRLPADIVGAVEHVEELTAANDRIHVIIALSYGGRSEIVHAARQLMREAAAGRADPEALDEAAFAQRLYAPDIPDPDLLIRTSGEKRISNFLLWQCAYAELHFADTLWPDFSEAELDRAIDDYKNRDRRYGAVSAV